jgi:putative FmdB family regulatory protein
MPLYEYRCEGCENRFEALVLSSDDEITCPKCEGAKLEKLFSAFGVKTGNSIPISSTPVSSVGSGCGCTPVSCGCSSKN